MFSASQNSQKFQAKSAYSKCSIFSKFRIVADREMNTGSNRTLINASTPNEHPKADRTLCSARFGVCREADKCGKLETHEQLVG